MKKIHGLLVLVLLLLASCSDVGNHDGNAERHKKQADAYFEQGQLRAALLEAQNYLRLAPEAADGYNLLAHIYNSMGAYSSTQKLCVDQVEKFPLLATPLAYAYYELKKYRSALDVLNSYPAVLPEFLHQQTRISALSNIALGDTDAYEKALQALHQQAAEPSEIAYVSAMAATAKGNLADAESILTVALEDDAENIDLLESLGATYLAQNQLDKAEQQLSRALALLPKADVLDAGRSRVLALLIDTLILQGRTSEAYNYQKIVADANPEGRVAQQRFDDALELYRQGNSEKAEVILNELREHFSADKGTAALLGIIQLQQGKDVAADALFDEVVDPETAHSSLIQAAAAAKYRTQQMDDAFALLKKAAQSQPNNADLLTSYGLALLDREPHSAEALLLLQKSLALKPAQPSVRIAIARRYLSLGQSEQALGQLQKAYEEKPLDLVVQQSYLQLLFQLGEVDRVNTEIALFRTHYPNSARADFIEAWFYGVQKQYKKAEILFESALSKPENTEPQLAHAGLASIYEQQGHAQQAYESWQRAIGINPAATAFYRPWVRQALLADRLPEAQKFLIELKNKTHYWQPVLLLAQLEESGGRLSVAIEYLEPVLEFNSQITPIRTKLASLYQQKSAALRNAGLLAEAKIEILKAVNLYPNNPQLIAALIDLEIANNNIAEAERVLSQLPQKEVNKPIFHYLQGVILRAKNKPTDAFAQWRLSWELQPSDTAANAIVANLQVHQPEAAVEFIEQWLTLLPNSHSAILLKAMRLQNQNKPAEAVIYYERALAIYPNNPLTLNNLAWLYYEVGDKRALALSARAAQLFPNSAEILDTHGWVLVEAGEVQEGVAQLEKAAQVAPEDKGIREHLAKAKARLR